jgi:DNA-binding LacI/PurR family transcriptional regulator
MGARAAEIALSGIVLAETRARPVRVVVDCPLVERDSAAPLR